MSKIIVVDEWFHTWEMEEELYTEFLNKYPFMNDLFCSMRGTEMNSIKDLEEDILFKSLIEEELKK